MNGVPENDVDYAFMDGVKDMRKIPELRSLDEIIEGKMGLVFTE